MPVQKTRPALGHGESAIVTGACDPLSSRLGLVIVYAWIVTLSFASLQTILPVYNTLRLREMVTIALFLVIIFGRYTHKHALLAGLAYLVLVYSLSVVGRSGFYGLADQIQIFVRVNMFFLLIVAVPLVVRKPEQARHLLLFTLVWGALLSLSAPIQEVTGELPWLYGAETDALLLGRGGYARYISIFGDPNVGGMLGGLLPIALLLMRRQMGRPGVRMMAKEVLVWTVSFVLVAYSLSFTALAVLSLTTVTLIWFRKRDRIRWVLQIGLVALAGLAFLPRVLDMFTAVIQRTAQPFSTSSVAQTGFIKGNLLFRLTSDLDVNDTASKFLFGSTYNVVIPARYLNPEAILAHNGYKEVFLAGGIVGLGIFLGVLGLTAGRACSLFARRRTFPATMSQTAFGAVYIFGILLLVMLSFPLYHYNGIGTLFWVAAGLVHALYGFAARQPGVDSIRVPQQIVQRNSPDHRSYSSGRVDKA